MFHGPPLKNIQLSLKKTTVDVAENIKLEYTVSDSCREKKYTH